MKTVINLLIPYSLGNFLANLVKFRASETMCSTKLINRAELPC